MRTGAIPTIYGNVRFRSRLEARWAAMFDFLGWRWEYEPIDLEGYIPDFVLLFRAGPVLSEIKPEFTVEDLIAEPDGPARKIDRSGWHTTNINQALILGATWNLAADGRYAAGALRRHIRWAGEDDDVWGGCVWCSCGHCEGPSLYPGEEMSECVACGAPDFYLTDSPDIEAIWRAAGSAVQWKRGR